LVTAFVDVGAAGLTGVVGFAGVAGFAGAVGVAGLAGVVRAIVSAVPVRTAGAGTTGRDGPAIAAGVGLAGAETGRAMVSAVPVRAGGFTAGTTALVGVVRDIVSAVPVRTGGLVVVGSGACGS